MRKPLICGALACATSVFGLAGLASYSSGQCVANGGNYVITQSTGAIVPGTTDVGNHTDDSPETLISLPFTWSFYGTAYDQVQLGSNGNLSFGASGGSTAFGNSCLPTPTFAAATMCPYWDDLRTDAVGSGIFTSITGAAPNRIFNIEWRATFYTGAQGVNMEVRLYENQARFDFVYGTLNVGGSGGTIGCQDAGGARSTQFMCDTANNDAPVAGTVLSFGCASTSAPSCSLAVSPSTGASGDTAVVTATIIEGTPASPPYTVMVDASQVNAGTVQLFDDGPAGGHGDAVAGDRIFTNSVTIGAGTPNGAKQLISTVTDSANPSESSTCSTTLTVNTVALAATGSATPATNVPLGSTSVLQINVTPATGPASTGIQVSADLSSIGGSATQQFYDDGSHGDPTPGDNQYTFTATITGPAGNYNLPFNVSDAQSRSASGTIAISTYDPSSVWDELNNGGSDTGDLPGTAQIVNRPAPVSQIRGNMDGSGNDADMYQIHICDPANFSATTVGGSTIDTQLWLFTLDGHGIEMDDDDPAGSGLQSRLSNQFTSSLPPGDYLLAITGYNQDANDDGNQLLFVNTCPGTIYRCEHSPDGPGAASSIDHWDAGGFYTGAYTIFLTGVGGSACGGTTGSCCTSNSCTITAQADCTGTWTAGGTCTGPGSCNGGHFCGSADFNCDGDIGTDADINDFFACLSGNCPPLPCISSADFNGDGDVGTDQDIDAFFRVLSGGSC